ncbi:hypothetical protein DL764_007343 [Monosporascus ibericus]|uniref:Uncharacterized protein n=1 Tax=Monosporascus ibericus TaxID=155417 RepID=A0A4V1X9Q6_9PEZI|nr:hypothetical protein DL764_007343 [Monosporascus ibericus]
MPANYEHGDQVVIGKVALMVFIPLLGVALFVIAVLAICYHRLDNRHKKLKQRHAFTHWSDLDPEQAIHKALILEAAGLQSRVEILQATTDQAVTTGLKALKKLEDAATGTMSRFANNEQGKGIDEGIEMTTLPGAASPPRQAPHTIAPVPGGPRPMPATGVRPSQELKGIPRSATRPSLQKLRARSKLARKFPHGWGGFSKMGKRSAPSTIPEESAEGSSSRATMTSSEKSINTDVDIAVEQEEVKEKPQLPKSESVLSFPRKNRWSTIRPETALRSHPVLSGQAALDREEEIKRAIRAGEAKAREKAESKTKRQRVMSRLPRLPTLPSTSSVNAMKPAPLNVTKRHSYKEPPVSPDSRFGQGIVRRSTVATEKRRFSTLPRIDTGDRSGNPTPPRSARAGAPTAHEAAAETPIRRRPSGVDPSSPRRRGGIFNFELPPVAPDGDATTINAVTNTPGSTTAAATVRSVDMFKEVMVNNRNKLPFRGPGLPPAGPDLQELFAQGLKLADSPSPKRDQQKQKLPESETGLTDLSTSSSSFPMSPSDFSFMDRVLPPSQQRLTTLLTDVPLGGPGPSAGPDACNAGCRPRRLAASYPSSNILPLPASETWVSSVYSQQDEDERGEAEKEKERLEERKTLSAPRGAAVELDHPTLEAS